jgi:hypothetical protein
VARSQAFRRIGVKCILTLDPNLAKHLVSGLRLSQTDRRALVTFLRIHTDGQFARAAVAGDATSTAAPGQSRP